MFTTTTSLKMKLYNLFLIETAPTQIEKYFSSIIFVVLDIKSFKFFFFLLCSTWVYEYK